MKSDKIHGFYYDAQMSDPLLTVTLHPNTELKNGRWKIPEGEKLPKLKETDDWDCYRKKPIATAILSEDFQVEVANNWTEVDNGNALENIWNQVRGWAPMMGKMSGGLRSIANQAQEVGGFGSTILGAIGSGADWLADAVDKNQRRLNKALYVQGTKFTYYGGTSTSFGNLVMKYTIFSDWVKEGDSYVFKTVNDQLKELLPYVSGVYDPITKSSEDSLKTGNETLDNTIGEYVGWQTPPGGFEGSVKNLDTCLKGTLRLRLGGYYSIDNLVCRGMSLNLSKAQAKDPTSEGSTTPLYAEVGLTFSPASSYTNRSLYQFINMKGSEELIKEIQDANADKIKVATTESELEADEQMTTEDWNNTLADDTGDTMGDDGNWS